MKLWPVAIGYIVPTPTDLFYATAGALAVLILLGAAVAWLLARRAVEALRLSEERYALALDVAEEGHLDWNAVTQEFFASDQAKRVLNLPLGVPYPTRDDVMGRVPYHPDDLRKVQAAWRASLAGSGAEHQLRYRVLRGEEARWIQARWKIFRDEAGTVQRVIGVVADITEQMRAEGLLAGEKALLEIMARATPLPTVLDALCRIVEENCGECACSILLVDRGGIRLEHGAAPSLPREYQQAVHGAPISPDIGPCARAAFLKEQVISADLATETGWAGRGWHTLALAHGLRSCWSTPIISSTNKALGTFALYHRSPSSPTRAHQAIIERFTHLAAVAIERSRAENELRESEARFRSVIEVAPVAIALTTRRTSNNDPLHRPHVLQVNQEFTRMFGFTPEEIVGRQLGALLAPADLRDGFAVNADAMTAGNKVEAEVFRQRRDGTRIHVHLTGVPIRLDDKTACTLLMYRDLTERELAIKALRESEARFRALTELSSDWYWAQDENMRFTYFSGRREDSAGYLTATSIGKARWEIEGIAPLSGSWAEHRAMLDARRPFRDFEYSRVAKNGEILYASTSGTPVFDEQGRFVGYQGVSRDITERKRLEQELRRAQNLEALGTLAGGIAHDFNNILGAILGYGEMAMRDAKQGTRLRRDLDSIMAAGERGRALVDRVLAFSRSGVGERVPVHVEAVVREALDQVAASVPANVTIMPRLHAGPAAMLGDPTQVHQVVMNLCTNAVQAMPQGGVLRVTLEAARVGKARTATVGTTTPGEYIVLKVSDTGTGIPEDVLERMFDPFFTTKEVGVGSGLGLSLVHGIVTSVGGAIDVAAESGKGSRFCVYLPRSGDVAERPTHEDLPLPRGDGQRVLVVDDEEPLVRLATETLEGLGYAPVGFTSSAAALAAFRADPARFDAVLTDERMPEMSGSALIREVRGIRGAIPIVLMSGFPRMDGEAADVVVRKPLSARDLAAGMVRALRP